MPAPSDMLMPKRLPGTAASGVKNAMAGLELKPGIESEPPLIVHHLERVIEFAMADITAQILTEIRDEAREFRAETRENFGQVFHRLALVETITGDVEARLGSLGAEMREVKERLTSLERHMAALLALVPVMNERMDRLEARIAALEGRA
jgi:chromosome segregation ATPase